MDFQERSLQNVEPKHKIKVNLQMASDYIVWVYYGFY